MKRVILESPYAGDTEANVSYARRCILDCLMRGEAPIASHLLYTQVLSDEDPVQRTLGIEAGLAWLCMADLMVVYDDNGLSPGMLAAISLAKWHRVEIEYRRLGT